MKNEKVKFIIIDVIAITVLILSIGLSSILFFYAYKLLKESKKETIFVDEIIETQVYKEKSDILEENGQETIEIPDIWVDTSSLVNKAVKLDVEYISQYPELPTGCEITSLATVLNYYGYEISKTELSENYLEKAAAPADWRKVFVGDPTDEHSFGCYSYPIVKAANSFLNENGAIHRAVNISRHGFLDVLREIDSGKPVIIWGTQGLAKGVKTIEWTVDGKKLRWIAPEHCMVLIGYDLDRMIAVVSDPQKGIAEYNIRKLKQSFETMYSQCIVIETNE